MKNFLLTAMLLASTTVFGQVIGLSGFEVRDDGTFRKSFKTEQEAIQKYQEIISVNGFDTLNIVFDHGDNPVVFDSILSVPIFSKYKPFPYSIHGFSSCAG